MSFALFMLKVMSNRKREVWFWVGVFFMPLIFTWFTLRKKYGFTARAIAFSWLIFANILVYSKRNNTDLLTLGDLGVFLIPLAVIFIGHLLFNRASQGATVKGTAGKTLIFKSLKMLWFGNDKQWDMASKGMEGERKVGQLLNQLPEGWHVWHDLDIGGENVDHVVASAKGIFIIEVKNYTGSVLVIRDAIYTHGSKEPNKKLSAQVMRQVYKLRGITGAKFINPVMVFLGKVDRKTKNKKSSGVICLQLKELLPYLHSLKQNYLSYEEAKQLFVQLDRITK